MELLVSAERFDLLEGVMSQAEELLFWLGLCGYTFSFLFYVFGLAFKREGWLGIAHRMLWGGFIMETATIGIRWIAGGHIPVNNTYEQNLLGSWAAAGMFLFLSQFREKLRALGAAVSAVCLLVLGYGYFTRTEAGPLSLGLKSAWLVIHVLFAWIAFGCFTIALGVSVIYLFKRSGRTRFWDTVAPGLDELDDLGYRFVGVGFVTLFVMIASGAVWANSIWGHYWQWDPVETWSLVTILIYGSYLHLHRLQSWKGVRSAWLLVGAFVLLRHHALRLSLCLPMSCSVGR